MDQNGGFHGADDTLVQVVATMPTLRELLVVDPGIDGAAGLIEGRRIGIEVLTLTPDGGGLEQIAAHLAGRCGIVALHVLCHGEPGALVLAGERIDLPALAMRSAALLEIAEALAPDATVLLYGCSVAVGAAGLQFLDYLETALAAGVAASAGPVGAAALGGRWMLRNRYGNQVETAFSPLARATFPSLLSVSPPVAVHRRPGRGETSARDGGAVRRA